MKRDWPRNKKPQVLRLGYRDGDGLQKLQKLDPGRPTQVDLSQEAYERLRALRIKINAKRILAKTA